MSQWLYLSIVWLGNKNLKCHLAKNNKQLKCAKSTILHVVAKCSQEVSILPFPLVLLPELYPFTFEKNGFIQVIPLLLIISDHFQKKDCNLSC